MKTTLLACALALAALPAAAKDKLIPLTPADAALLQGKKIAVTMHERPSFSAMTAGKASFGLLGAAAMIKAGNDLVDANQIVDPAVLVRERLGSSLAQTYGAEVLPVDTTATKAKKAKDVATTHPEADYVLDVRSGGWGYVYFPTDWNNYQIMYSVQVQLVDVKTGRQVSNAACNASSKANKTPPTREQLHADGAQLIKDYTTALGWNCVQLLTQQQLGIPAEQVPAVPEPYAGLILRFTPGQAAPAPAPVATPVADTAEKAPAADATSAPPAADGEPETAPAEADGEG